MSESAHHRLQLGPQSSLGTAVAATTIYPCDPGASIHLARGVDQSDFDLGVSAYYVEDHGHMTLKSSAVEGISSTVRFEDIQPWLEMSIAGGVEPSGTAAPFVYSYTPDTTSNTVVPHTIESVDEDGLTYRAIGCHVTRLELGFDAIGPGESTPWTMAATVQAIDRETMGTATTGLPEPTALETVMAHNTKAYEGAKGTAYACLTELSGSLVSYHIEIEDEKPLRYNGGAEKASSIGRRKRKARVSCLLRISAETAAATETIYNVSGSIPTERRWRIQATGSESRDFTIDHQLRFTDVYIDPDVRDGERLMSFEAVVTELAFSISTPVVTEAPEFVQGGYLSNTAISGLDWTDVGEDEPFSPVLVVIGMWQDSAGPPTFTYGGTALTAVPSASVTQATVIPGRADHTKMQAFYILNPVSDQQLVFNQVGYHAYAVFSGINPGNPFADVDTATGSSTAPAVTTSDTSSTLPFAAAGGFGGSDTADPTADATATEVWSENIPTGLGPIDFVGSYDDGGASFTMGSSKPWVALAIALRGV